MSFVTKRSPTTTWKEPQPHSSGYTAPELPSELIPRHVALVMDGNGRWATHRGLVRTEGHKQGERVLFDMVEGALEIGISWLSAYAFSTENWKRDPEEVRFLMGFNRDVIRRRRDEMNELGVRIVWSGNRSRLWKSVIKELEVAQELTQHNTRMTLNMCVNYGGRAEITHAVQQLSELVQSGKIRPDKITEKTVEKYLYHSDMPDVDLFLRPSGEQRLSNFLLWQSAYAELVFQDKLFPDCDRTDLWAACLEYASRNRRFGSA